MTLAFAVTVAFGAVIYITGEITRYRADAAKDERIAQLEAQLEQLELEQMRRQISVTLPDSRTLWKILADRGDLPC